MVHHFLKVLFIVAGLFLVDGLFKADSGQPRINLIPYGLVGSFGCD
jgi:hypothetical protein